MRTSGRYPNTFSFHFSLCFRISFKSFFSLSHIFLLPSASHSFSNVLLASSPFPKSADTAVSERGSLCGLERERAESERAWRVNPCSSTSVRAVLRSCCLDISETVQVATRARSLTPSPTEAYHLGAPIVAQRRHGFVPKNCDTSLSLKTRNLRSSFPAISLLYRTDRAINMSDWGEGGQI